MLPVDALKHLGVSRVIWIDDVFGVKPPDLAELLFNSYHVAAACNFAELQESIAKAEFSGPELIEEIAEILAGLPAERQEAIRNEFFAVEAIREQFATREVSREDIESVCAALEIHIDDRWTFAQANAQIDAVVKEGDSHVAFIIDLNEAGGADVQGLEILKLLHASGSQSTAFILTHAAKPETEATKEGDLRKSLGDEKNTLLMPICVIAKKRLEDAATKEQLDEELLVSIKRASLRKSMSEVVSAAGPVVEATFREVAAGLLSVPPEQLEEYVYERGYLEGVSELHVVERIVSSQIGQKLQSFFGKDPKAQQSASRLRKLRGIKIDSSKAKPDARLVQYRLDEVWESADLINSSYSPISCGDVFVVDRHEKDVKNVFAMFVVLAQPCDIALRPTEKFRTKETAVLVPLVQLKAMEDRDWPGLLPCDLNGARWRCDFDAATLVSVPVLDLASFRIDGRVRFDEGQLRPTDLVPSHDRIYEARVKNPNKVIGGKITADGQGCAQHPSLQLTFGYESEFSHFYIGRLKEAKAQNAAAKIPDLPKRVTWRLQRIGRIRAPYSISFLEDYLRDMGRRAFDRDFTTTGAGIEASRLTNEKANETMVGTPAFAIEAEDEAPVFESTASKPQKP